MPPVGSKFRHCKEDHNSKHSISAAHSIDAGQLDHVDIDLECRNELEDIVK